MASSASPKTPGVQRIVLLGAGGHGRVALDVCRAAGLSVAGFLDGGVPRDTKIDGVPVLGDDDLLADPAFVAAHAFLPGIGNQKIKRRLCEILIAAGGTLATVVHPFAAISPGAVVGGGSLVAAGAVINTGARIGRFCIINTRAGIDHDCDLADGAQVGPGATLCGAVRCGADALIGSGAIILPGKQIGAAAVVGAGAVVTRDVSDGVTVAGNPACPT